MLSNKPFHKIFLIIFGIFLFLVLLESVLRLSGFIYLSLQEYRNALSRRQPHDYRIMCLGESTTAMGGENSYPAQLEKILNQRNIGIKFCVINKGRDAVTTSYILNHLEENIAEYNPDMVITMMGIGDGSPVIYHDPAYEQGRPFLDSLKIWRLTVFIRLHFLAKFKGKTSASGSLTLSKNTNIDSVEAIKLRNYQEVKRILDKRGIRLVCSQYPLRSVEPLKEIFQGQAGVIFVDNEKVFKDALRKKSYRYYFTDTFGNDFGHCTPEGNRLLAENIADTILRECFKR